MFLGMQVGRSLTEEDDISLKQWQEVLSSLEEEFGLRHNDNSGNMILIPDTERPGKERLVAIDLEDVTFLDRSC